MTISKIIEELLKSSSRPNKFTIGMGALIRKAREDSGLSQRSLSEQIYLRQATISDLENGKTEPDAEALLLLSTCLSKPLAYFFPSPYKPDNELNIGDLNDTEKELIIEVRKLDEDDSKKIVAQVRALAKYKQDK